MTVVASLPCRICGSGTESVLDLGAVPVGSCVLLPDAATAEAFPVGGLRLAFCPRCEFIQNDAFDEGLVDYESGYEESQASSPTFLRYSDDLIDLLDRRHGLAGATILEPGCGKGEFLVRMCERLGCRGIGVDPAHDPTRITTEATVAFHVERFTAHSELTGDLVICRHTLEHIADVPGFVAALAAAAGRTPGAAVVIEVPESLRILDEGAFWDVYYEHASYFTADALRAAARLGGLSPVHVDLMFSGQYLVLDAVPAPPGDWQPEGARPRVREAVRRFAEVVPDRIEGWRRTLAGADRPVLWGASSKAVGFLSGVGRGAIDLAVDINPHKQGSYLAGTGVRVAAPGDLVEHRPDLVVVMNPVYRDEITAQLDRLGLSPRIEVCS